MRPRRNPVPTHSGEAPQASASRLRTFATAMLRLPRSLAWSATLLVCCFGESLFAQRPLARLPPMDSAAVESPRPDTSRTVRRPPSGSGAGERAGFFAKVLRGGYPNPERAAALSFVLPGAGQVYNRKLWYVKVPVIYAAYGFLIWRGEDNRALRDCYQGAYLASLDGQIALCEGINPEITAPIPANVLQARRDRFTKNFQLAYIGVVAFHFVQTLEAYTTAHLFDFDMDESLTVGPRLMPVRTAAGTALAPGLGLRVGLGVR